MTIKASMTVKFPSIDHSYFRWVKSQYKTSGITNNGLIYIQTDID